MKPRIYWYADGGCYICQYDYDFCEDDWYVYLACGAGNTMREAYESWLRDCEK